MKHGDACPRCRVGTLILRPKRALHLKQTEGEALSCPHCQAIYDHTETHAARSASR